MKTKNNGKVPVRAPKDFHPNSACIAYANGEGDFIVDNIFTPAVKRKIKTQAERRAAYLQDENIPAVYRLSPSYYYRDQIARCIEITDSRKQRYTDEVVKYVVQAVKQFGVDALQLNTSDKFRIHPLSDEEITARLANFNETAMKFFSATAPGNKVVTRSHVIQLKTLTNRDERSRYDPKYAEDSSAWISELEKKPVKRDPLEYLHPLARAQEERELFELRYREGLGDVICDVLRYWREQVQRGSLKERQLAAKHLGQFGKALIPETRGKRRKMRTATSYEVQKFYYKELFRLYHVELALRELPGSPREKVQSASKNFEISEETIRDLWFLDKNYNPKGRPDPIRQRARLVTARHFKITEHAVSNLLSAW